MDHITPSPGVPHQAAAAPTPPGISASLTLKLGKNAVRSPQQARLYREGLLEVLLRGRTRVLVSESPPGTLGKGRGHLLGL